MSSFAMPALPAAAAVAGHLCPRCRHACEAGGGLEDTFCSACFAAAYGPAAAAPAGPWHRHLVAGIICLAGAAGLAAWTLLR